MPCLTSQGARIHTSRSSSVGLSARIVLLLLPTPPRRVQYFRNWPLADKERASFRRAQDERRDQRIRPGPDYRSRSQGTKDKDTKADLTGST
jgi:hypothetical protein